MAIARKFFTLAIRPKLGVRYLSIIVPPGTPNIPERTNAEMVKYLKGITIYIVV